MKSGGAFYFQLLNCKRKFHVLGKKGNFQKKQELRFTKSLYNSQNNLIFQTFSSKNCMPKRGRGQRFFICKSNFHPLKSYFFQRSVCFSGLVFLEEFRRKNNIVRMYAEDIQPLGNPFTVVTLK